MGLIFFRKQVYGYSSGTVKMNRLRSPFVELSEQYFPQNFPSAHTQTRKIGLGYCFAKTYGQSWDTAVIWLGCRNSFSWFAWVKLIKLTPINKFGEGNLILANILWKHSCGQYSSGTVSLSYICQITEKKCIAWHQTRWRNTGLVRYLAETFLWIRTVSFSSTVKMIRLLWAMWIKEMCL